MSFPQSVLMSDPWNKGKLVGQNPPPLKQEQIWSIRIRLEMSKKFRDLALFNLALDSKLRSCDLVKLLVRDVSNGSDILARTQVVQQKTKRPVMFEITAKTRESLTNWIKLKKLSSLDYLFQSRRHSSEHITTRQYARLVKGWGSSIGLDRTAYGTHSLRRTKPTIIYRKTKNLRAVQILLGHTNLESTVRYLGVEVDDAFELSEHIEI